MSQQLQYPQQAQQGTQYQAQTPMGQQFQQTPLGQAIGRRFSESVPNEVVRVAQDLDRLETVAEWVQMNATQRGMHRLARVCQDLQDIAHLEKKLVVRQSPFAQPIGQAARQVIQQGIQELQQHLSQPEVQEALSEAQQSINSIDNVITRLQSFGQQQYAPGQFGGGSGMGQQYGVGQPGTWGQHG